MRFRHRVFSQDLAHELPLLSLQHHYITYRLTFQKMCRAILSEFPASCNAVHLISKSQDTNNTRLSRYLTTLKTEDRYMAGAVAAIFLVHAKLDNY